MLGDNLTRLRIQNDYSLEELARAVGVPIQLASEWEQGTSVPDADMTKRLAELLGVSVTGLLSDAAVNAPSVTAAPTPITPAQRNEAIQIAALKRTNERLTGTLERLRKRMRLTVFVGCAVAVVILAVLIGIIAGQHSKIKKLSAAGTTQPSVSRQEEPSESESVPELMKVPELIGKSYDSIANDPNYASFFVIEKKEDSNSAEDPGTILQQDPPAGTEAPKDTVLTLTVSVGLTRMPVPDFTGMLYDDVISNSAYTGFLKFSKQETFTDSDDGIGRIRSQSVAAGTPVLEGTLVVLTVDAGRRSVELTDVTDMDYDDAVSLLRQLGVTCTKASVENDGTHTPGTVAETVPPAGSTVRSGDEVEVAVWGSKPVVTPEPPADEPVDPTDPTGDGTQDPATP